MPERTQTSPQSALPAPLDTPGAALLPGGLPVVVGKYEESWICVELGWGLRATLDFDDKPGWVYVGLHLPYLDLEPVGSRPYGSEAAVRVTGQAPAWQWEVVPLPVCRHDGRLVHVEQAAFDMLVANDELLDLLALLARLPRRGRGHLWPASGPGTRVWLGQQDALGGAHLTRVTCQPGTGDTVTAVTDTVVPPDPLTLQDGRVDRLLAKVDAATVTAVDFYLRFALDDPFTAPEEERLALRAWLADVPDGGAAQRRLAAWATALAGPLWRATSGPRVSDQFAAGAWSQHSWQVRRWQERANNLEQRVWAVAASIGPAGMVRDQLQLAEVLAEASDRLSWHGPGWDAMTALPRPQRWTLRAFLDPGAGLLWSGDERTQAALWDYPVDHRDLPIGWDLVGRINALLDRYERSVPVRGTQRNFTPAEWTAFRAEYRRSIQDLRLALGPAYTIRDEQFGY